MSQEIMSDEVRVFPGATTSFSGASTQQGWTVPTRRLKGGQRAPSSLMSLLSILAVLLLLGKCNIHASAVDPESKPWMDSSKPIQERVEALLARLSVEQKIAQTFATHTNQDTVRKFEKTGVGASKYMSVFNSDKGIQYAIKARNALQADFVKSSGVPISFINEGLHGGAPGGTIFPMPVNQGAAWNVTLTHDIARIIAIEARSIGVDTVFAPVVNMITDPRFGRLQEGYSENPLITSHLGRSAVLGLQNSAPQTSYLDNTSVSALGKHYAAYGSPAGGQNGGPATMSKRALFETYLRPWKSMASAGIRAVMPAHNTVLDVPCHANEWLIKDVLRDGFGFGNGIALSDCNDIGVLVDFRLAANRSHAAALGLKAGVDWDLQCGEDPADWSYNALPQAIEEGLVSEADLDDVVRRVLTHKFAAGLFDEGPVDVNNALKTIDAPSHRQLAREAAEQSIVLLLNKDGNAVPLMENAEGLSVALLGPTASSECKCGEATFSLVGSYGLPGAHVVTLDEALAAEPAVGSVEWAPGMKSAGGPPGTGGDPEALSAAVALANRTDVSILVLGDIEGKSNGGCGEWGDRDSLDLQGGQLELLQAVSSVAAKTIVVLVHGRPQTFGPGNYALDKVDALFAAWRPGEEFGNAMASLLFGRVSPSAKLAQSWPRSVGHIGSGSNPWLQRVRGKWLANHKGAMDPDGRAYDNYLSSLAQAPTPLFYFGHGLSYSLVSYEKIDVVKPVASESTSAFDSDATLWVVHVTLKNIGNMLMTEVVQIYVEDPVGLPFVPFWKRLIGFDRVILSPGETKTVEVKILRDDVSMYEAAPSDGGAPVLTLFPGQYRLTAGGSSYNATLSMAVEV